VPVVLEIEVTIKGRKRKSVTRGRVVTIFQEIAFVGFKN